MRLSYTAEQFLLYTVCILIIAFLVLILRDIYHIIKKTKETKKRKKLSFDQYETIKSASLDDYIFYAPYGVSQSLIKFISEAPNFINAVADINQLDYPLTKNYQTEHDPHMKDAYIDIAVQLSNIISNKLNFHIHLPFFGHSFACVGFVFEVGTFTPSTSLRGGNPPRGFSNRLSRRTHEISKLQILLGVCKDAL